MTSFLHLVRQHQLAAFFSLALALSWFAFIPFYLSNGDSIPWFTFGPMVSGFVVAALSGGWASVKAILASVVKWRVSPLWYLVAFGLPFGTQLASILVNPLFGSATPVWSNIPAVTEILPIIALYAVFSGPLGEEPGWRGFATPRLMASHSALAGSLILGAIWAIWHFPLGLVGDLSVYGTINVVLAAVVFTWLYQNTGSVLLAILMHVTHQNSVRFLGKVFIDADHVQQQWIGVAIWAVAAVAIVVFYGTESFVRRSATQPTLAGTV
ncbi:MULTISPECIES: type II CAAX endopeptidase family protein [unclassified Mesorhizobium]|uniref:CPBP family intramembrane glutamic endopeptidase n=1 Tax=unclassified Mesorhizobium TaxID=325217 RepID=UPI0003CE2D05|nr:type II CAAX endopeptidase family protein [Mesorhizobium sp. LSHC420B00]ESX75580.1 abortive infection protein [Mesorhizobium sp. LSHC420B00]